MQFTVAWEKSQDRLLQDQEPVFHNILVYEVIHLSYVASQMPWARLYQKILCNLQQYPL